MFSNFYQWLEDRTARWGGKESDETPGFDPMSRRYDNDIAEGDWEAELEDLVMRWVQAEPGPGKDILKKKVDDYFVELVAMGNKLDRAMSILSRATHGQRPGGSFISRARRSVA